MRARDYFVQRLISKSIELKNQVIAIDEKKNPQTPGKKMSAQQSIFSQAHIGEMMSELELAITKLMLDFKDDSGSILADLRDHIIEVYQKVGFGLLKRQLVYDEMLTK